MISVNYRKLVSQNMIVSAFRPLLCSLRGVTLMVSFQGQTMKTHTSHSSTPVLLFY